MAVLKKLEDLTEKGQYWARYVQEWQQSNLTQSEYCRNQNISVSTFSRWKQKLYRNEKTISKKTSLQIGYLTRIPHAEAHIVVSDIGVRFEHINLFNLLLKFEKAGYDVTISRRLRRLAFNDIIKFVDTISSWKSFKKILSSCSELEWIKSKTTYFRYQSLRRAISRYVSAVNYLKKYGKVSIDDSSMANEFSPYYVLGRELPIVIEISSQDSLHDCKIKIFSSGILSASAVVAIHSGSEKYISQNKHTVIENEDKNGSSTVIPILKKHLELIKNNILKQYLKKKPGYAFYYSDRYQLKFVSLDGETEQDIMENCDSCSNGEIMIDNCAYAIFKDKTIVCCDKLSNQIKRSIYVFEIAICQKYFLTTRDSYIDNYIRNYRIGAPLKHVENFLSEFLEMMQVFMFSKEEGGKHKLFSDPQFYLLFNRIHQCLGISELSVQVNLKAKDALNMFSLVSAVKREKALLNLTYFIAILTFLLSAELFIKAFQFVNKIITNLQLP